MLELILNKSRFVHKLFLLDKGHPLSLSLSLSFSLFPLSLSLSLSLCLCLSLFLSLSFSLSRFLDAPSHLYKRVCPSVRRSVGPSVRLSVPCYFQTRTRRILCRVSGLVHDNWGTRPSTTWSLHGMAE